jgi:hypothetical protein
MSGFTRVDGAQIGLDNSGCTRLHPSQVNQHWALRVDGHPVPTAQCVPYEPRAVEDLTPTAVTVAEFASDPMAVAPYIKPGSTIVLMLAGQVLEDPQARTQIDHSQIMGIMNSLASGPIECLETIGRR